MLTVNLKEALENFERRTGLHLTYEELARRTGLAKSTIEAIASRPSYNTTLTTLDRLCAALGCTPVEILHHTAPDTSHD